MADNILSFSSNIFNAVIAFFFPSPAKVLSLILLTAINAVSAEEKNADISINIIKTDSATISPLSKNNTS